MSEKIWRVLACPVKVLTIGKNGDRESRGNWLTGVYLENGI